MNNLNYLIDDSEKIGRFIFSKDHFNAANKEVKYAAFMPAKDNKASVYRIDGFTEEQIWSIDHIYVSGKRTDGKVSVGRADLIAEQIRQVQLDVVSEPDPHIHHANIQGYPIEKSAIKLKAIELAKKANFIQKNAKHVPNEETEKILKDTEEGLNLESHNSLEDFWSAMGIEPSSKN